MGQRHAEALQGLGMALVGVADSVEAACAQIVQAWQGETAPAVCTSLEELLQVQVPELLVIATTADGHAAQALQAIEAGVRWILLEKPVATSLAQCVALQQACERTGARIAVNHQMRFLPQYCIPKDLLGSAAFGGFHSMHVAAGNFGMAMNATHYFEAFRFLAGEAPAQVSAWFDSESLPNPRGPQFQDVSGCIRVTTAPGHRLYIDASADQGHGVQVTYMARNGRITIDELTGAMAAVVREAEHRDAPTSRYGMPVQIQQQQIPAVELVESTKAVLQALIAGENYPTLADATLAVKTLVAAYHSHRQGGIPLSLASVADDDPEVFPWA
ncbi:Gfo/Idh/MocA family oxidoreductase [Cyanobium sp. ATX 6E8]|nr:Gfo/Idh/MocA family oxidoreductase [Cyanobium sp. ATX 6E8]